MPIIFPCTCGHELQEDERDAGMQVRCPGCGAMRTVPGVRVDPPRREARSVRREDFRDSRRDEDDYPRRRDDRGGPRSDRYEDSEGRRRDRDDYPPLPAEGSSGKAKVGLVFGILTLLCVTSNVGFLFESPVGAGIAVIGNFVGLLLCAMPAMVLGMMAQNNILASRGRLSGRGIAKASMVCGFVGGLVALGGCVVGGTFSGVASVREAAARQQSANNLKQIGIAMHNYHDANGALPTGASYSKDGKPLLSWRVAILPYVEEQYLYEQFALDEPWDSPRNRPLVDKMPKVYAAPGVTGKTNQTYYRIFHRKESSGGRDGEGKPVFDGDMNQRFVRIDRGTSNTILVVEAAESVPWTKPDELPFPVQGTMESQLGMSGKNRYTVLMADGTVRIFTKGQVSDKALRDAITIDGQEKLPE